MVSLRQRYEGKFLEGGDLPEGQMCPAKIVAISEPGSELDGAKKVIEDAILSFEGIPKRLILGKTNYSILCRMFETKDFNEKDKEKWHNQTITLQRRYGNWFGQRNVMAIRVIPQKGTAIPMGAMAFMGKPKPE